MSIFRWSSVIGLPVVASTLERVALQIIKQTYLPTAGGYVCLANTHMLVFARRNRTLKLIMESAKIVCSDGMPLVWELRRKSGMKVERVSGLDLMIALCEKAQQDNLPVYFYGASFGVIEEMEKRLGDLFPNLPVAGMESPPMLPDEPEVDQEIVGRIIASGARIVFVGLGCPKQEFWMYVHAPHIPAVLIGVGAAFDFLSGSVKRAPLWMQNSGLEWFYRLCSEPRRLWKRYLINNFLFSWYWLLDAFHGLFASDSRKS